MQLQEVVVETSPYEMGQPFSPLTSSGDIDAVSVTARLSSPGPSAVGMSLVLLWQFWYDHFHNAIYVMAMVTYGCSQFVTTSCYQSSHQIKRTVLCYQLLTLAVLTLATGATDLPVCRDIRGSV